MERVPAKSSQDAASFGAEALPARFGEIDEALNGSAADRSGSAAPGSAAPLVGLIALAANWMKKRGRP